MGKTVGEREARLEVLSKELEAKYGFTGEDYEQLEEEVSG